MTSSPAQHLPGFFVTGTDTGVGKTYLASSLARLGRELGRRVAVLKPVAAGASRLDELLLSEDAEILARSVGGEVPLERVSPIVYEAPLAPCLAARAGGERLSQSTVESATSVALAWWVEERNPDVVIVEGVGGLLCPLSEGTTVADLATWCDFPLVIVARNALGTLNHTLMTVEVALGRSLRVAGVVLNQTEANLAADSSNAEELARRLPTEAPLLAVVDFDAHLGLSPAERVVDWYGRAQPPRLARRV
jgi:dethiobiotin synthetase